MAETPRRPYLKRIGTSQQLTSAYHPRANGKCERFNGTIGPMIKKYVGTHRTRWDQYLHQSLFACRVHISQRTYVRLLRTHVRCRASHSSRPQSDPFIFDFTDPSDFLEHRKKTFQENHPNSASKHLQTLAVGSRGDGRAPTRTSTYLRKPSFQVGDFALVKNYGMEKLVPHWYGGPLQVERITLPGADPPYKPVIRLSVAELDELKKQLDELLSKKLIKPSTSPYGAPVLFVKKADGFSAYVC